MGPITDQWLNYMPPTDPSAYRSEYVGRVFRYRQGLVSVAPGYEWLRAGGRGSMGGEGRIVQVNSYGGVEWMPLVYKTQSVFACSAHLPVIVLQSDASMGSCQRTPYPCRCQPSSDDHYCWNLLHFTHMDEANGVSYATANCEGRTYVAGRSPSWMPALVPRVFENTVPSSSTPRSQGLAGELPLVIALMAFHSHPGGASEVFNRGMWDRKRWRGPDRTPVGCKMFTLVERYMMADP